MSSLGAQLKSAVMIDMKNGATKLFYYHLTCEWIYGTVQIKSVSARTYQTINLKNGTLYAATWSEKLENV